MMRKMNKILALVLVLALSLTIGVVPVGAGAASGTGYTDVDAEASYAEAVELLTEAGVMNGIGGNRFGPGRSVNRAEAITVLGRLAGAEQVETDDFADVESDSWYSGYVGWAVENGIVEGDGKGNFLPYANVTSEHLNLMLSRYAELMGEEYTFYDTGADTVARADLAQRIAVFLTGDADSAVAQVDVTGGTIEGYVDSNGVSTYKGIPYAASTAGENRWKDPQPVEPWDGVKQTVDYGAIPLQNEPIIWLPWTAEYIDVGFTLANGKISEDSLNLNVWTTGEPGDDRPVLVYIHGGGNTTGSGANEVYTGEHLAQKGIVYVSINYRVGTFGFLAAKDETGEATGNFAYKDQIAALKWIQENIETFGGDPTNVTIAGQSAGASNVQTLITSPAAEGLFNKAIVMSGNSWRADAAPLTTLETAQENSAATLEELGYTLAELRAMSTEEVYAIMNSLPRSGAVNDGEYVTQNIAEAYAGGDYNLVDMLIGNVSGDGGGDLSANMTRNYEAATAKNAGDPTHKTYTYGFTRIVPDADPELQEKHGAFHTGDVGYWTNHFSTTSDRPWTETDYELGEIMSSYLVNFVTTGDPNGADSNGNQLPVWKDVASTDSVSYIELGDTVQFVEQ